MVDAHKQRGALAAINAILVLARALAYEGKSAEVAQVLDVAEYLPMLMLERDDKTNEFRDQLVGLAERYPDFQLAVERFDNLEPPTARQ
jgi:hypothetical protein